MKETEITINTQQPKDIYYKFFAICTALGAILIAIYLFCGGKSVEPTSLIKLVEVGALISLGIASFCALASNNLKFKIIWAMYATLEFMFATHLIFRFFKIY